MHFEKTVTSKTMYLGRVFSVEEQTVELENGRTAGREIVRHNGGAAVVAVDAGLHVCLIRQFRKPLDRETLEIPAGKLEVGEDPYCCAVRELKEETGCTAEEVAAIGVLHPSPGYCDETLYLYLATGLVQGQMRPDPDEFITLEKHPLSVCVEKIENGEITDAKSIVGILAAARKFGV